MNECASAARFPRRPFAQAQVAALLVAVATLASMPAFSQTAAGSDDASEALHNIQSNFARMTPPPRTIQSINQDLKQDEVKSHASAGGGRHGGGGRRGMGMGMGRQSAQQGDTGKDAGNGPGMGGADVPPRGPSGDTSGGGTPPQ